METQLLTIELKCKTKRKEKGHISRTKTEETHYADGKYQEYLIYIVECFPSKIKTNNHIQLI